jgi:hypothetical protein
MASRGFDDGLGFVKAHLATEVIQRLPPTFVCLCPGQRAQKALSVLGRAQQVSSFNKTGQLRSRDHRDVVLAAAVDDDDFLIRSCFLEKLRKIGAGLGVRRLNRHRLLLYTDTVQHLGPPVNLKPPLNLRSLASGRKFQRASVLVHVSLRHDARMPTADAYVLDAALVEDPPRSWSGKLHVLGPAFVLTDRIVSSAELIATTTLGAKAGFMALSAERSSQASRDTVPAEVEIRAEWSVTPCRSQAYPLSESLAAGSPQLASDRSRRSCGVSGFNCRKMVGKAANFLHNCERAQADVHRQFNPDQFRRG